MDISGSLFVSCSADISCCIAFDPFSGEVVSHDMCLEALEPWVLGFVEPMAVQNWDKRVMVSDDSEVR